MAARSRKASPDDLNPGITRTVLCYGERMMMVELKLARGTRLKERAHPEEEVCYLVRGTAFVRVRDRSIALTAGESVLIPADTAHAGEALTDCTLVVTYSPPRPELLGEDA